jgi:hypothetical protein
VTAVVTLPMLATRRGVCWDADELEFLTGIAAMHKATIDKIDDRQSKQKARPNPKGSAEGPSKVNTNAASSRPGPKGDPYAEKTPEQLKEYLKWLREPNAKPSS